MTTPSVVEEGQSVLPAMISKLRTRLRDRPDETVLLGAIDETDTAMRVEDPDKFERPGLRMEFDDGTTEAILTTGVSDGEEVPIRRGRWGTPATSHSAGTTVLFEPRFSGMALGEAVSSCIDGDLFPHVWVQGELRLDWQVDNEYFDPGIEDIIEVVAVWQLRAGQRFRVKRYDFTPGNQIADEEWPNGLLFIPRGGLIGNEDIYIGFKALPTVFNLTEPRQQNLAVAGAHAAIVLEEEAVRLAPNRSAIMDRISEGAGLQTGRTLRAQFIERRDAERNLLLGQLSRGLFVARR